MGINIRSCYTGNGALESELWFIEAFKVFPSCYHYYNDEFKPKTSFFTKEKCKELFGTNIDVKIVSFERHYSTSSVEDEELYYMSGSYIPNKKDAEPCVHIANYDEQWIAVFDGGNSIKLYYDNINASEVVQKLISIVPRVEEKESTAAIELVAYDRNYYTITSKIKRTTVDFDTQYNDDLKEIYNKTIDFIDTQESGLVIWRGEKGTGKTTMIRHLISSTSKKYLLITNAVAAHMAEPEFIAFLMENKNSIFILEDCEQILMNREENRFGGAISNILNMSDGLMSDIFNIKFICTFNTDINNIDSALLRPGRCFVNYEFKALDKDKSTALLKSLGHDVEASKDMTLAEIYNFEENKSEVKPKKIGF